MSAVCGQEELKRKREIFDSDYTIEELMYECEKLEEKVAMLESEISKLKADAMLKAREG